jgi:hypothetical protein
MTVGPNITKRARLRLIEHRDPFGNRPTGLSGTFPVNADATILSGQLISVKRNTVTGVNEWVLGYNPATSQGREIAFAIDDSTDPDVIAAGNLRGLSARGRHDISTPYTKAGETYQYGTELTYDAVTGFLKAAVATNLVVAVVSKDYSAPVNHATSYVPNDATADVSAGVTGGSFHLGHHTAADSVSLTRIITVEPYVKA